MFDIGFMELLLVGIVALLVLGPEKMPGAIRTGALWIGRARRSFNKVKIEIEQQLNADEIRRQLHNESILADIEKARQNADKLLKDTQKDLQQVGDQVKQAGDDLTKTMRDIENMPVVTSSAEEGAIPESPSAQSSAAPVTASESAELPTESGVAISETDKNSDRSPPGADTAPADSQSDELPPTAAANRPRKKPPVQDFYNTPPTGRVTLQDGHFTVAETPATDSEPDRKA